MTPPKKTQVKVTEALRRVDSFDTNGIRETSARASWRDRHCTAWSSRHESGEGRSVSAGNEPVRREVASEVGGVEDGGRRSKKSSLWFTILTMSKHSEQWQ